MPQFESTNFPPTKRGAGARLSSGIMVLPVGTNFSSHWEVFLFHRDILTNFCLGILELIWYNLSLELLMRNCWRFLTHHDLICIACISMTSLLTHTVAHSTRLSFRPKTNNQPIKKFLILAVSWLKLSKIAKFWLSKSIFNVKKYLNLTKKNFHWRISF